MIREDWVEVKFDELVMNIPTSNKKIKQRNYLEKGKYPVVDQGKKLIGGYIDDEKKLLVCDLPVLVFGDHTKVVKFVNFKFAPGADGTKILAPKKFVEPKCLYYITLFLANKTKDMGYARHYQYLRKKNVLIAPLPEQRAIVSKIEELFSELDSGIDSLKKAKEQLEIYRQAVLKAAFEGKLTKERKCSIKWVTIGEICENVEYGTSTKSENEGIVPVVRMGNVQNGKIIWEDLKYTSNLDDISKYKLYNNDVLFNRTNSPEHVGKTAIFKGEKKAIFAGYLIRINYKRDLINGDYLNYFLNSHNAKMYGNSVKSFGVNQSNINGTKLKGYPFPLIDIREQNEVVIEIESRLSVCENIEASIEEALEKAEALRQSILKKAFEGKLLSKEELEVCKKEDDWEPAEVLLKRIKETKKEAK